MVMGIQTSDSNKTQSQDFRTNRGSVGCGKWPWKTPLKAGVPLE